MFDSMAFSSLRLLALITHFVMTTGLVWTRYDSLQVTLKATATRADYNEIEGSYLSLISFGLISLALEMLMTMIAPHHITLFGTLKLFLDVVATFFIAWIILDGLEWLTYVYIFVFCVIVPTVMEATVFLININKNIWVDWRRTRTVFMVVMEVLEYIWSWLTYLTSCVCSVRTLDVSAWTTSCLNCFVWVQAEGITGVINYISSCFEATATPVAPSTFFEDIWNSVSSGCMSAGNGCVSFGTALMSGPTGIMEFCTSGINSCAADDSIIYRAWGCFTYMGESLWGAVAYMGTAMTSCWREYGPVLYNALISLRDLLWSWLMWFWRQVRLFFT